MKHGAIKLLILMIFIQGCTLLAPQVNTVYVPEGDAVMLRQDVDNVKIWAKAKDKPPVPGKMKLEEGWM